jgi:hypothetical protein
MVKPVDVVPVKGQHIFPNDQIKVLALKWKDATAEKNDVEAMALLESIIMLSTDMFQRLAQHEKFHYVVPLDALVAAAQEKVANWLLHWEPSKGELFSWFSKCAKNAFRSEVVKQNQFKSRFHATGDNLEKFFGAEDPDIDKNNLGNAINQRISSITCRWSNPQERDAIRFHISAIMSGMTKNKAGLIRTAAYAYGISPDYSKFFYSWSLYQLRNALLDMTHIPVTEQDLFRLDYQYDHLADLLDIITWDQLKKIIVTLGGTRLRIPTVAQLAKTRQKNSCYEDIDQSDGDPDSVSKIGSKYRMSQKTAQEVYEEMSDRMSNDPFFDDNLFDEDHGFNY